MSGIESQRMMRFCELDLTATQTLAERERALAVKGIDWLVKGDEGRLVKPDSPE